MPRLPVDYSKTLIYKLVHKEDYDNANVYIGSTTDFRKRKNQHKSNCCNEKSKVYDEKKYQYIRANGGWDCFNMIEVEKFPCNDKREAEKREEYWRCHFNATLNTIRVFITKEQNLEYYKEYNEKHKEQKKEYCKQHKEQIKEQKKEYYIQNKDKILEQMKEKVKIYRVQNINKIKAHNKEYSKEYRKQNKDKINEKITCDCGCIINKRYLNRHLKTQKHTDFILL